MKIKIHIPDPPAGLLDRLATAPGLAYTRPNTLYHLIWINGDDFVGVFGAGDNGSYEWFDWSNGRLETSNCGFGSTEAALREVLNQVTA